MKGRRIIAVVTAFGLGGLIALLTWLAIGYTREAVLSNGRPTWTEVAWPFGPDEWGRGKAFRCKASDCGSEVDVYIRAKIGFCDCTTGVADDDELDRLSDLHLMGEGIARLGAGRPIGVAWMKGRSRVYSVAKPILWGRYALSVAFNDRCDAIVATALIEQDQPDGIEPKVIEFLNGETVMRWAEVTLGL